MGNDRLSLSSQFLIAAAVVLCLSMAVLGTWLNHQITRSVLSASGAGGSHFIMGYLEAEVQNLAADGSMPEASQRRLDAILVGTPISKKVVSVKIWRPDGKVIYSSASKDIIGKTFESEDVKKAANGHVVAEFEDMISAESAYEQSLGKAMIEIYSPLYKKGTTTAVAVGEFYEDAELLDAQLSESRLKTATIVCITTALMLTILYLIVRRGSFIIDRQRSELRERIADARKMASQNEQLRLDANEANEELLGRLGSDIHDGPIQNLALAQLRLDEIVGMSARKEDAEDLNRLMRDTQDTIADTIEELRQLSTGLVLPELNDLSLEDALKLATSRHENLTGTKVALEARDLPERLPEAMKICVYRIVQESLTNAYRHAGGLGQRVRALGRDGELLISVSDEGGRLRRRDKVQDPHTKLGHRGIRNRVQSFGGSLTITTSCVGTEIEVSLPLDCTTAAE